MTVNGEVVDPLGPAHRQTLQELVHRASPKSGVLAAEAIKVHGAAVLRHPHRAQVVSRDDVGEPLRRAVVELHLQHREARVEQLRSALERDARVSASALYRTFVSKVMRRPWSNRPIRGSLRYQVATVGERP